MNTERIQTLIETYALPRFRGEQLRQAFFREHAASFDAITTLPKALRQKLDEEQSVLTVKPELVMRSKEGNAFKALMVLSDGLRIETVLLMPKPGLWTTCISSQVGCALKCSFCATGRLGFTRNLSAEEITDQVLFWRQFMDREIQGQQLQNVVYMGMGEPFQNKQAVFASLSELSNNDTFNMGSRHLSVSTAGLVPAMMEMADTHPQVNLALSLHAANDDLRLKLMPINKKWTLEKLADAIRYWLDKTNRKLFIEYILIDGTNDKPKHAEELANWLLQFGRPHLIHVNLIPCNPTDNQVEGSRPDTARAFKQALDNRHIMATIHKTLGRDLDGACGQLALKTKQANSEAASQ